MIPSYGRSLGSDEQLCHEIREWTSRVLELNVEEPVSHS
jgi:hypothetical protein